MKPVINIMLICFLILGAIETSNGQQIHEKQKIRIEKEVDKVFLSMVIAAEKLDYDKLTDGVDDSFQAGFIVNKTYYSAYDSLIPALKSGAQRVERQIITINQQKITVLSKTIALLTATGTAEIALKSGNGFSLDFYWSFVYENIDGEWKVIQSHQSNNR